MASFVSYNPANREVIGVYPVTCQEEVACALEQATALAVAWAQRSVSARCALLQQLQTHLGEMATPLAETVTREIGKPLQEAYGADLLPSLEALSWLVRNAPQYLCEQRIAGRKHARLSPEPVGVVGVIGTWNYPLFLNIAPIAWALAAGNAVLWKPSELGTASALLLASLFERVGLPVVTVTGDASTGRALCGVGCDKVAFTGSVPTGRAILGELAKRGTPAVMELSGNDALIVCEDAPVELAARSAVWGRCCNAGQSCVAPQRIFVAEAVYERFLEEATRTIQSLTPGVDFGPMRTEELCQRAQTFVWDAIPRGARLLAGGHRLKEMPGFYYAPTLLADCHKGMLLMEQDFFGPVVAVCAVHEDAEAIALANASDMALGASIWTRSARRGQEIAARLQVGTVAINDVLLDAADPALPFGGLRSSGFGKQRGRAGLDEFTHWKAVSAHGISGERRHLFPYRAGTLPILQGIIALRVARGGRARWDALRQLSQAALAWNRATPSKKESVEEQ